MLARIVAMLTRLVDRFDLGDFRVREEPSCSRRAVMSRPRSRHRSRARPRIRTPGL
jgi:hypothetical protein